MKWMTVIALAVCVTGAFAADCAVPCRNDCCEIYEDHRFCDLLVNVCKPCYLRCTERYMKDPDNKGWCEMECCGYLLQKGNETKHVLEEELGTAKGNLPVAAKALEDAQEQLKSRDAEGKALIAAVVILAVLSLGLAGVSAWCWRERQRGGRRGHEDDGGTGSNGDQATPLILETEVGSSVNNVSNGGVNSHRWQADLTDDRRRGYPTGEDVSCESVRGPPTGCSASTSVNQTGPRCSSCGCTCPTRKQAEGSEETRGSDTESLGVSRASSPETMSSDGLGNNFPTQPTKTTDGPSVVVLLPEQEQGPSTGNGPAACNPQESGPTDSPPREVGQEQVPSSGDYKCDALTSSGDPPGLG